MFLKGLCTDILHPGEDGVVPPAALGVVEHGQEVGGVQQVVQHQGPNLHMRTIQNLS